MFEICRLDMDSTLAVLVIEKILYDHGYPLLGTPLDEDSLLEASFEAIEQVSENCVFTYDEEKQCEVFKLEFPEMERFNFLCKEFGRINHIAYKKNPYVKEANIWVNSEMSDIRSYAIDWALFTPKRMTKKKSTCLAIFLWPEFYQPVDLVDAVCNIRDHYKRSIDRIEKELRLGLPAIPKRRTS